MNRYELALKLLVVREKFFVSEYNEINTKEYFNESVQEIHNFFAQDNLNPIYLFSSLGYYDQNKTHLIDYRYNEGDGLMDTYSISLLESLTKEWINQDRHLSITKMFLHEKNFNEHYKALFYHIDDENYSSFAIDEMITLNLKSINWSKKGNMEAFKGTNFKTYNYGLDLHKVFEKPNHQNPFLTIFGEEPGEDYIEEFNRLISIYLELSRHIVEPTFFYFIRPNSFHKEFNGVLLLGLKRELSPDELSDWVHIIHRMLSEIAVKKIQKYAAEKEMDKYRTNINYTVHYIKTMLGGLMDSPLNKLSTMYPDDENVRMVKESKEIIEGLSSILNLITKVEENKTFSKDDLIKSKLFSNTIQSVDISALFLKMETHRKDRRDSKKVIIEQNNIADLVSLIKYEDLYPTENFYLLYFLTLIENAFEHGKTDYKTGAIRIKLNFNSVAKEFIASNLVRNNSIVPKIESVKGNIKLIDALLNFLKIGNIQFQKENIKNKEYFKTVLKLY